MKNLCKIGVISGIFGIGAIIVKEAFEHGFMTAGNIFLDITNDVLDKYDELLDDYKALEREYDELLDECYE